MDERTPPAGDKRPDAVEEQATRRLGQLVDQHVGDEASTEAHFSGRAMFVDRVASARKTSKRTRQRATATVAAAAAMVVAVAGAWFWRSKPEADTLTYSVASSATIEGSRIEARGTREAKLRFSDGTRFTMSRGSVAQVDQATRHGAQLELQRGELRAQVQNRPNARWQVVAGPFHVRVTGTTFAVNWDPGSEAITVALHEGRVHVTGPNDIAVQLQPGHKLLSRASDPRVSIEPLSDRAASHPGEKRDAAPRSRGHEDGSVDAAENDAGMGSADATDAEAADPSDHEARQPRENVPDTAPDARTAAPHGTETDAVDARTRARTAQAHPTEPHTADTRSDAGAAAPHEPEANTADTRSDASAAEPQRAPAHTDTTSDDAGAEAPPPMKASTANTKDDAGATSLHPTEDRHADAQGGVRALAAPRPAGTADPQENPQVVSNRTEAARPSDADASTGGSSKDHTREWTEAIRRGAYAKVIRQAKRQGLDKVLSQCSREQLVALADAGRYRGNQEIALGAMKALWARFPGSGAAQTARFLAGRIYQNRGRLALATRLYKTYLAGAPQGAFAEKARGRLMTVLHRRGKNPKAQEIAEVYLERYPDGAYASIAKRLLNDR